MTVILSLGCFGKHCGYRGGFVGGFGGGYGSDMGFYGGGGVMGGGGFDEGYGGTLTMHTYNREIKKHPLSGRIRTNGDCGNCA